MMREYAYKKLLAWQKADELAYQVYLLTAKFPREEIYGITSQLRRAALSVSINIAEGCGRQNKKETRQFANIALGSLAEVKCLLDFSLKLKYIQQKEYEFIWEKKCKTGCLLWGFYNSL